MKKSILSILLIVSLLAGASPGQKTAGSPATKPVPYQIPIVTKTLANGLEVIVLPDSSVPLVTVELDVRNGSFTEPPEYNGLSHLFEHMFFKPNLAIRLAQCEKTPSAERLSASFRSQCGEAMRLQPQIGDVSYLKDAEQLGFYNGTTREEVVNYFFNVTTPYLAAAIRQINDSVRFPTFDETEFANEKKVVIGELDRHESNPYEFLDQTMKDKLYFKYPTRKKPGGTRETVAAATTDQMRTIQSRYYVPNNSALVVTGDVRPEEVFRVAEQVMGSWEKRKVDPFKEFPLVEHPPLPKNEAVIIEKQLQSDAAAELGENVLLELGWQGPSIGKDNASTYAADVFSYIISQPNSQFQRALIDSGLASSAGLGYYTQRNVGPINLVIRTTPDKAKEALKATYAEIAKFDTPGYFTDEELDAAKTILESNDLFEREKLSDYAHTLGFWWSSTGIEYFRGYHQNLRAMSRGDINTYLRTYIKGKNHIALALLSPSAQKQARLTEQDLIGAAK